MTNIEKSSGGGYKESRNYGIDALKILAMYMVVIRHILGVGGIIGACSPNSTIDYTARFLDILASSAVDIFAMTTGYLMIDRRFRYSRILALWVQVVFYTLAIGIVVQRYFFADITLNWAVRAFFPIITDERWYFTAYFGMFFLIPFMNKLFNSLSQRQARILMWTIGLLFSGMGLFNDAFHMNGGYSTWWLCSIYLIGAYIRRYLSGNTIRRHWLIIAFFGLSVVTLVSRPMIEHILLEPYYNDVLISYMSPTVVGMAISLLLLFSNLRFPTRIQKILAHSSPLSFAVYLIHVDGTMLQYLFANRFANLAKERVSTMILMVICIAMVIYVVCSLIEAMRVYLFRLVGIDRLIQKVGDTVDSFFDGLWNS